MLLASRQQSSNGYNTMPKDLEKCPSVAVMCYGCFMGLVCFSLIMQVSFGHLVELSRVAQHKGVQV